MHILFTRFPLESSFGGAEVQTLSLMKGLMERSHNVSFLGSCASLLERLKNEKMKSEELQIGKPPVTKFGAITFFWRRWQMKKQLIEGMGKQGKVDVIFMLSLSEKLLLTTWCHDHGIKVIWVEHDRVGRWLTKNPWLPMLRNLSRFATTVVVSSLSIDLYRSMGWKGEIVAIPNGVDIERFSGTSLPALSRAEGRDVSHAGDRRATFHIGCIARLTKDKGVDVLIEALKDLPNIHLTIIGSGKEEDAIRSLMKKNLQPTSYKLQATHENIADFYHSLDLLILPSREHDPFGLVVAEAMASGVPTICTDACGIASYLDPSQSMIVRAGNVKDLRDTILQIQQYDKWMHLAKQGPIMAKNRFSLPAMVERYEALLY